MSSERPASDLIGHSQSAEGVIARYPPPNQAKPTGLGPPRSNTTRIYRAIPPTSQPHNTTNFIPMSYNLTEEAIQDAIEWMGKNEYPSIRWVHRKFDLPYHRLLARWNGRLSKLETGANNCRLPEEAEQALLGYINRMDSIGTCALFPQVHNAAQRLLWMERPNDPPLGRDWVTHFIQRYPQAKKMKQKPIELQRAAASDPVAIQQWFKSYKKIVDENGILPGDTYNFDESGFRIGVGGNQWIVILLHNKRVAAPTEQNRDFITLIEAISGDGVDLPPALVMNAKNFLHHHFQNTELPSDYLMAVSDSGYSNDDIAYHWIQHFNYFSAKRQVGSHRLLLFDGHGSHLTKDFIQYCDNAKIIPFSLPPHTSHIL